jgi:hypothetical protein
MEWLLAIGLPLQLQKLTFSSKQKFIQNPDNVDWNWVQIFFWTDGLYLMNRIEGVLHRISSLDTKVRDDFWQGSIPAQFFEDFPWLEKFNPAQVIEYCRIRQSRSKACDRLIIQARGERLCPKGAYSKLRSGEEMLVEEKFLLNAAAKSKSVKRYYLSQFIFEAAKQNNVRFFIRLGKVLQSRKKIPDVDWTRCDPVACFLVENWCEWREYDRRFPALCFFSDLALADFCSAIFGRKSGNPSVDSIRQSRRRLGLKQASRPKVRQISLKGSEVLFEGR